MKRITQFSILLLTTLMLLKAFIVPIVYIDFKLNQDYIAKVLCINRDKPQLHCNGKCILMQKIKKAQKTESQDKNQTAQRYLMEIFCNEKLAFDFMVFSAAKASYIDYQENIFSSYLPKTFHPPQATRI